MISWQLYDIANRF